MMLYVSACPIFFLILASIGQLCDASYIQKQSNSNVRNHLRTSRHLNIHCGNDFQCDSGECISSFLICDGLPDCKDASDETKDVCQRMGCPHSTYTCDYGACVNKEAACNGILECMDGSDEIGCSKKPTPRTTHVTSSTSLPKQNHRPSVCRLPEFLSNGEYEVHGNTTGDYVSEYGVILAKCRMGFTADPVGAFCFEGSWSPRLPRCTRMHLVSDAEDITVHGPVITPIYIQLLPNSNHSTHLRPVEQLSPECGRNSFRCSSGQCIWEDKECDGKIDCDDESDETEACKEMHCNSPYLFRCSYGGCIRSSLTCNGVNDCKDGSDEMLSKCSKSSSTTNSSTTSSSTSYCGFDFKCDSGECISSFTICDGVPDCEDASDETKIVCQGIVCPHSTYTCDYGACVTRNARCNGIIECIDGSDESSCSTKPTPRTEYPTTSPPTQTASSTPIPTSIFRPSACRLPVNGEYEVPGDTASEYGVLRAKCKQGFVSDPAVAFCLEGIWSPRLPECVRACAPLNSTNTTKFKCTLNGKELDNCGQATEGTYAEMTCADYYENPGPQYSNLIQCRDGAWNYSANNYCKPKCGQKFLHAIPSLINGTVTEVGIYPWQVGIYRHGEHICGGAVLSARVVISAAHCFTNLSNGSLYPVQNYVVTAGKYDRNYYHPNDIFAQYSMISNIELPKRYKGRINQFEGDLAILILSTPFNLSERVQPVCIDLFDNFEHGQFKLGDIGIVAVWEPIVAGNNFSKTLKELEIPYISYAQCYDHMSREYQPFIRYDKICGGYLNEGKSVCGVGSGGGALLFKNKNNDRYYIRAVVGVLPSEEWGQCNSDEYILFTSTTPYISTIRRIVDEYP